MQVQLLRGRWKKGSEAPPSLMVRKAVPPTSPLTISPSVPPKSKKRRLAPSSEDICSFSKGWRSSTARAAFGSAAQSVKPLSICTERLQGRPFHVQAGGGHKWAQSVPPRLHTSTPTPTSSSQRRA